MKVHFVYAQYLSAVTINTSSKWQPESKRLDNIIYGTCIVFTRVSLLKSPSFIVNMLRKGDNRDDYDDDDDVSLMTTYDS